MAFTVTQWGDGQTQLLLLSMLFNCNKWKILLEQYKESEDNVIKMFNDTLILYIQPN